MPDPEVHILRNHEIPCPTGNYIDENHVFHGEVHIPPLLHSLDLTRHALVLINPGNPPESPAVVKLLTYEELAQLEEHEKQKIINKQLNARKQKKIQTTTKEFQITWAISPRDLGIKLKKAGEYLDKGSRIEIVLAGKKGMKKVTLNEMNELLAKIEEWGSTKGREWKAREGEIGAQLVMFFLGGASKPQQVPRPEDGQGPVQQFDEYGNPIDPPIDSGEPGQEYPPEPRYGHTGEAGYN